MAISNIYLRCSYVGSQNMDGWKYIWVTAAGDAVTEGL